MPEPLWIATTAWYAGLNAAAFALFAWDKRAAARGDRRTRERTLLLLTYLGGFVGALAAMRLVRHKTRKWAFRVAPALAAVLHAAAWIAILR
ncbi:MAG: DUF1294 domain-containing protein [Phycisphaerales bacterium]|nr:DUF1294 domain-containing protein [Phycisphaerales bacterium]